MSKKNTFFLFTLLLSALLYFTSCEDGKESEPEIETVSWSVEVGYPLEVYLTEGNNKYSITVDDKELANATYTPLSKTEGKLVIEGKKKGKTTVTIKDDITGDKLIINLEVIIYDFVINETEVNASMFLDREIPIISGNRKYEISVENEEILAASLYETAVQEDGKSYHLINISVRKPGKTRVIIKDIILDEEKTITVNTSFPYLSLSTDKNEVFVETSDSDDKAKIENDILLNSLLQNEYVYSMVRKNGLTMPLYIFKNQDEWKKGKFSEEGHYSFMIGANIGLYYTVNNESHTLYMEAPKSSYTTIFKLFDIYYINDAVNTVDDNKIILTEDLTEKYKSIYPSVTSVKVQSTLTLHSPYDSQLPLELVQ